MALVTLSGLVSNVSGSIGGSTFQRSAAGLVMRKKPKAVGRGSSQQFNQRGIIARMNFLWNELTDEQRQLWSSFAVYTNGVNKTNNQKTTGNNGKTQFFAVNSWLYLYGRTPLTVPTFVPPLSINPSWIVNGNQSNDLGKTLFDLDTTSQILVTRVSLPQSKTTVTANTGFRTLVYGQIDGTVQDWSAAYLATFGVPLAKGFKYWVSYRVVDFLTGAISAESKSLIYYTDIAPSGIGSMVVGSSFIVS